MNEPTKSAKVIRPVRWAALRADEAQRVIQERTQNSENVIFGEHAMDRVDLRSITEIDARRILSVGTVEGEPELCPNGLDWKVIVVRRMPGGRDAGVVTVIFRPPSQSLFIVTVEWMDHKR